LKADPPMPAQTSAGLLMYRGSGEGTEVFLVHPGGPFWAKKDAAAWSIPKGIADPGEDLLAAARREFHEETGFTAAGDFRPLGAFNQPGGKIVHAWAFEGDCDPSQFVSNAFEMEWPPKSGKRARFPEVDRAGWFGSSEALRKIHRGQQPILFKLFSALDLPPLA
jgi:predicted NUDIX family NTP pyrophosphohydrolase